MIRLGNILTLKLISLYSEFFMHRVKFREDIHLDKLKFRAEEKRAREKEKVQTERRLEALASTVRNL